MAKGISRRDALIYLGTEFCRSGWNTRNGEVTWHSGNFPDPKGMIDKLPAQHFRVVLHTVIEGRLLPGTVHESCDPKNAVPNGRTPDNRWPDARGSRMLPPAKRSFEVRLAGKKAIRTIVFEGRPVDVRV
jgi:hypothetical protein